MVVEVLSWVDCLVFDHLDDLVDSKSQKRTHYWTEPVDIVVAGEVAGDNTWSKATGRVQAATGVEDTNHLCDEKGQPNSNGSKESRLVLFGRKHEDRDNEQRRKEHLHKDSLSNRYARSKGSRDIQLAWEHSGYDSGSADASKHLRYEAQNSTDCGQSTDEIETKRDLDTNQHPVYICGSRRSLTAGLKSPPLTRKNTQTLTIRLNPKIRLM